MKNRTVPIFCDALFEIGTEELPATNLADIFEVSLTAVAPTMLERVLRKVFEEKRLSFKEVKVFATPRRLVFWVIGVSPAQNRKENLIKGPSKQDAYSGDGQPTDKLLGFLKAKNASVESVEIISQQGRDHVYVRQAESVKKAQNVLPEIFLALVKSLSFVKNMRWDDSGIYFPRPIRHALCFYGRESLKFKIGNTPVKNETTLFSKGERSIYKVKDISAYFSLLKKNGVILDPAERKKAIREILEKLAISAKGRLYEDPFLLSEVNFLVETPDGLSASFGEEFLTLPSEVLTVSMARKQRLFGALDKEGRVIPKFFGILDGRTTPKDKKLISENFSHILRAKLQDSLFFYKEDVKVPLEKKRQELKDLIFLKNAGSMLRKSDRLVNLATRFGPEIGLPADGQAALERACLLSKADLLTQMVGEFPELQGVMGKYYALENGEKAEVAEAIGEQYLPRTVQDALPATSVGSALSILDKCDLIVACFMLGLEPSSSLDPYALRRSATAIFKIILERKWRFSLADLLEQNIDELKNHILRKGEEAPAQKDADLPAPARPAGGGQAGAPPLPVKLQAFFKDRFKALLTDKGYHPELVEAVMASGFEAPYETYSRLEALSGFSKEETFLKAWKVVERTSNILKGNKEKLVEKIDPAVFVEALERGVFERYERSHVSIRDAVRARDFKRATSLYADAFFDILGEFFEKVFVNAEDLKVRKNRLALLLAIKDLYTKEIADLSKIHSV